jgi:hypothetical protein
MPEVNVAEGKGCDFVFQKGIFFKKGHKQK